MARSSRPKAFTALVLKIMQNILKALQEFHLLDIMHRDLKPENIIFRTKDSDTDIVIIDFGLAVDEKQANPIIRKCGTPGFIAPEVFAFKKG